MTDNVEKAVRFEAGNRAHGSVDGPTSFYSVSSDAVEAEPGQLLKLEEVTDTIRYTMPPGLSMSRFIYQSLTSDGVKVPVSGCVLWPYTAFPYENGLPVVAWSHGTSGSNAQCAPSNIRNLWHHFQAPYLIAQAGFVVVATDYAGLGVEYDARGTFIVHEYLTGPAQANDVLFSILAARQAFPSLSSDFVLVGSSQGGSSVWSAAQSLAKRPMEGYLGTVNMSPVTRFLDFPLDGPVLPAMVLMVIRSIEIKHPEFRRDDVLTPKGVHSLETYLKHQGCNSLLFNVPADASILKPGWHANEHLTRWQSKTINGCKPFAGPMLVLQGGLDQIVDAGVVTKAVSDTATMFPNASIEYHLLPDITHASVMHAGSRVYLSWIADRFLGKAPVDGLQTSIAKAVRPGQSYQAETNFILQLQAEPWQAT